MNQNELINTKNMIEHDEICQCGLRKKDVDQMGPFELFSSKSKKKTASTFRIFQRRNSRQK